MKLLLALAAAAALASSASAANPSATVVIRHQTAGCHAWSVNGSPFRATQTAAVRRGGTLTVLDYDVMPHLLLQTRGPAKAHLVRLQGTMPMRDFATPLHGPGLMAHMGAEVRVSFPKPGVYAFTTRAGEDFMTGFETTGPDNVLHLTVKVS